MHLNLIYALIKKSAASLLATILLLSLITSVIAVTADSTKSGKNLLNTKVKSEKFPKEKRAKFFGKPGEKKKKRAEEKDGEIEEDDPDVPPFARGLIDKETYLMRRDKYIAALRGIEEGKKFDPAWRLRALRQLEVDSALEANTTSWTQVGPAPIPNGQTLSVTTAVSGRVTTIAVHPSDPNKVYVGTAGGGLYRSLDGGTSWTALMDSAQSLSIGAVTFDPLDPTTIWVGTGEGNLGGNNFFGVGIYRIKTAETAPTLEGPFQTRIVGTGTAASNGSAFLNTGITKIAFDPNDSNRMFVGNELSFGGIGTIQNSGSPSTGFIGLYACFNAQAATPQFSRVSTIGGGNFAVKDIVFEPGSSANLVIAVIDRSGAAAPNGTAIWRSTNANTASAAVAPTFAKTLQLTSTNNSFLAVNKVAGTTTVVAVHGTSSGTLQKSVNGGATFGAVIASANGFCGGQCFYDMPVAIDPNDANKIYIGGNASGASTRIFARATNGTTFAETANGLHADSHAIAVAPSNTAIIYTGNDGGIFKSTDSGATWTSLNNTGFAATQFESIATHPRDREFMIGGTQDNGTQYKKSDGTWFRADFGDGGFALIDQNATDTTAVRMYHTYFNQTNAMGYARVTNSANATENGWTFFGCGFAGTANGMTCTATAILFYAPMTLGPGNPNTMYFGSDVLYRSTDGGTTVTKVSQQPITSSVAITAIGIAPSNDAVRLVGLQNGGLFLTTAGTAAVTTMTIADPVGGVSVIPDRYVSRIAIDKNDANIAYVALNGYNGTTPGTHVWKTTNLLTGTPTWTNAASGIPDVPVNAFVIDPTDSNTLYAGTDIGVYRSTNGGTSWTAFSTGLPRVPVFDMAFQGAAGTTTNRPAEPEAVIDPRVLRIATHGRGIWEIKIACPSVLVAPGTLPNGTQNAAYSQSLTGSGDFAPYTFAVTSGTLPAGLMLNPNGTLSGTPTTAGTSNFTVTGTSSDSCPGNQAYTLTVVAPTAASVTVSGRALTASGNGISNALVTMTDASGEQRAVLTNKLGYYRFTEVPAGGTYIFSIVAGRNVFSPPYTFSQPSVVRQVNETVEGLDFIAQ